MLRITIHVFDYERSPGCPVPAASAGGSHRERVPRGAATQWGWKVRVNPRATLPVDRGPRASQWGHGAQGCQCWRGPRQQLLSVALYTARPRRKVVQDGPRLLGRPSSGGPPPGGEVRRAPFATMARGIRAGLSWPLARGGRLEDAPRRAKGAPASAWPGGSGPARHWHAPKVGHGPRKQPDRTPGAKLPAASGMDTDTRTGLPR